MRRSHKLILSFIVFIILIGIYYITTTNKNKKEVEPTHENITLTQINDTNIEKIELKSLHDSLELQRSDQKWYIAANEDIDIIESKLNHLLSIFCNINVERIVRKNYDANTDLSEYGLDTQATTATTYLGDGSTIKLYLGNRTPDSNYYYIRKENTNDIYTIKTDYGDCFKYTLDDFRKLELETVDYKKLSYLYLHQKGKQPIEITSNSEKNKDLNSYGLGLFLLSQPYSEPKNVDYNGYEILLRSLPNFDMAKFLEDNPSDLSEYGLEEPQLEIILQEKEPETSSIKEVHYLFGNSYDEDHIYFKTADSDIIYTTENSFIDRLITDPFQLADKLIYITNINQVNKIDIDGQGKKYTLTLERKQIEGREINNDGETKELFKVNDVLTDDKSFRKLYQDIIGITADFEVRNDLSATFNQDQKITIKYYLNDDSTKILEYYPYDNNFHVIQMEPNVYWACSNNKLNHMFQLLEQLDRDNIN